MGRRPIQQIASIFVSAVIKCDESHLLRDHLRLTVGTKRVCKGIAS